MPRKSSGMRERASMPLSLVHEKLLSIQKLGENRFRGYIRFPCRPSLPIMPSEFGSGRFGMDSGKCNWTSIPRCRRVAYKRADRQRPLACFPDAVKGSSRSAVRRGRTEPSRFGWRMTKSDSRRFVFPQSETFGMAAHQPAGHSAGSVDRTRPGRRDGFYRNVS